RPGTGVYLHFQRLRRSTRRVPEHRAILPARARPRLGPRRGTDGGGLVESGGRAADVRPRARRVWAGADQQGAPSILRRSPLPARGRLAPGLPRGWGARFHHVGGRTALAHRLLAVARRAPGAPAIAATPRAGSAGTGERSLGSEGSSALDAASFAAAGGSGCVAGASHHVGEHPQLPARAQRRRRLAA